MNKRAVIISTAIVFGFLLVVMRLADLMLLDHDRLVARAERQYLGKRDLRVGRGKIHDRKGRELAVNIDVLSVYGNAAEIVSPAKTARIVSEITGENYKALYNKMTLNKGFVWLSRKLDYAAASALRELGLVGVGFIPDIKRFYPKGALASHLLGFVGVDNQPLEGIELRYDRVLRGREETVAVARDAGGRTLSAGLDFQSGGSSLVLTVDEGLQYITEHALDAAMEAWEAASASAIMMDPFTGEVLAMASRPTYDLNEPSSYEASARRNRAVTDSYEPGSTFKLITAAAALEVGVVDASSEFETDPGYIRVAGRAIWDVRNNGTLTFSDVIRKSSNVGTVMVGQLLDEETLYKYVKAFGFGQRTGIDLAGEAPGRVKPTWEWSETSQAALSIGYEVAVTPLQLLRAYSAVANGGRLVTPHVVSRVISPDGEFLYRFEPGETKRAISPRTADMLKEILISVTEAGGTAMGASVEGNRVAGKTGTTRLVDPETGRYSREKYASSFAGFLPADKPKVALVVVIFEPHGRYYGGQVAAPVFREIAEQTMAYLNVPREDDFGENILVVQGTARNN